MEEAASNLYEASVETHETTSDPYLAQLAKTKAARVESASKLLERAGKDPKVQKVVKRTARKGRGKGRGKSSNADGKGVTSKDNQGEMEDDDTMLVVLMRPRMMPLLRLPMVHLRSKPDGMRRRLRIKCLYQS